MMDDKRHTTIGLKKVTKARLNRGRAPGQCYDGFLCQLMDFWETRYEAGNLNNRQMNILPKKTPRNLYHLK